MGNSMGGTTQEVPKTIPGETQQLPDITYIEVIGHWLVENTKDENPLEIFRRNLSENNDLPFELEDPAHLSFSEGAGKDNVSEFRVLLKLKEPIND